MRILYFGGQKSGKSRLAEAKALELCNSKPYYIATYDNSYGDKEMDKRIQRHQDDREEKFITIEEMKDLPKVIKDDNTYLVDCISMWILNNIETSEDELITQIENLAKIDANIVFVLNDVNSGVIPLEYQSRRFVDLTGIIGQKLANVCDEVYEVKLGIGIKIK
jgi:adenosylcobinamide kinase/adenosylcobinamide-phosphate guanylyltransferase